MDGEISRSLLSNASNAPSALTEPVIQEDQHNDKTAEEKELAAAQLRLDELPMAKILSTMQKALPVGAHIDADVDVLMRTCIAKFAGVLIKEAKQQRALARHKAMQPEDIINAVKKLGFEGSSNALTLFYSRYTEATNYSCPWKVQLPVHTSELISTEIQQKGTVSVPTENPLGPNIGTHVQSPVHSSDLPAETMQLQGGVNVSTENAFRPNDGNTHVQLPEFLIPTLIPVGLNWDSTTGSSTLVQSPVHTSSDLLSTGTMQSQSSVNGPTENSFTPSEGSNHVQLTEHLNEPLPTEMQRQGCVNVPTVTSVRRNCGTVVKSPVHNVDPFRTEMQWQGSVNVPTGKTFGPNQGKTHVNPNSSFQHGGNATLLPPSSLPSEPLSSVQPVPVQLTQLERTLLDTMVPQLVPNLDMSPHSINMQPPSIPMQNQGSAQWGPLNLNPPSSDEPFSQLMVHSDAVFAQQVPIQMKNPQRDQCPREATAFNGPPFTQPINQSAFPRYTQMASQQQSVGGSGTTMAADGVLCNEAGSTSSVPLNEMMSEEDLDDALELLREYGVLSNEP